MRITVINYYFFLLSFFLSSAWLRLNAQFSNLTVVLSSVVTLDEVSFFIGVLTVLVVLSRFRFSTTNSISSFFCFCVLLFCCLIVFFRDNVFLLYCFYEASLVPIVFMILV